MYKKGLSYSRILTGNMIGFAKKMTSKITYILVPSQTEWV